MKILTLYTALVLCYGVAAVMLSACQAKCRAGYVLDNGVCRASSTQPTTGAAGAIAAGPASGAAAPAAEGSTSGPAAGASGNPQSSSSGAAAPQQQSGVAPSRAAGGAAGSATTVAAPMAAPAAGASQPDPRAVDAGQTVDPVSTSPCPDGRQPSEETCNGEDDDCDGQLDEELTMECGSSGRVPCQLGTQTCNAGQWGECVGAVEPTEEVCDAERVDENCDGNINEGCDCVPGETMKCGVTKGACREGLQMCTEEGKFAATCEGQVGPKDEQCEGQTDDDCDGLPDSQDTDCECINGRTQECAASGIGVCSEGQQTCSDGKWGRCVAEQRGCVCDDSQAPRDCGRSSMGACRLGKERCVQGQWSACEGAVNPTTERCDGTDSDCDGNSDAQDDDADQACSGGGMCDGRECVTPPPPTTSSPYHRCSSDADCGSNSLCSNAFSPYFCAPAPPCPAAPGYQTAVFFQTGCVIVCNSGGGCPSHMPRCEPNPFAGSPGEPAEFCVPGSNGGL